jgi:Icc protein
MTFRIVQITDCHLFADPDRALRGVVTWPRFVAMLQQVRHPVADVDLLVLTGDTAHDESIETYRSIRELMKDCFGAAWNERLRVIPGNHDNRGGLLDVFSQHTTGPADRVTFQIERCNWQVIGLDSHVPGELPGSLGAEQLVWLRSRLEATPLPTLLFVHHPPLAVHSPWLDRIGLQDAPEFETLLERYPAVRLVLCGHVHQAFAGSLGHAVMFTSPAVGPQFRPRTEQLEIVAAPPACRILELHSGGRWSTQLLHAEPG